MRPLRLHDVGPDVEVR